VIRTRFFDDFLLDACRRLGVRQVVSRPLAWTPAPSV
jgi:hypothetical protein